MISFCVCVLAFAFASAGEIEFDLEKLADFTADFEYNFDAGSIAPVGPPIKSKINGKGSMQVDVKGQRFRIAARTEYDIDGEELAKGFGKGKGKGSIVGTEHASITFSVPGEFASIRFWENVNTKDTGMDGGAELAGCALVNFPPGMINMFLPPDEDYKNAYRQLAADLKRAEAEFNAHPHEEETIDGKTVEVFKRQVSEDDFLYTGIEPDGSPFAVGLHSDFSDPLIKFTKFKAGSGDIEEMSCKQIPTMEFLAHPKAPKSLAILGRLVNAIRQNPTLMVSLKQFPSEFSNFFLAAAGTETARPICLAAPPPPQSNFIATVVAAMAGGVIGGAVILFAARQMAKRQVSLL